MIDLEILNSPQKEAVITTEGPLLVLAGAGSGKTRVLTYRIAFILDAGLAGPENILAMTFTNKAAGEMKDRIKELLAKNENVMSGEDEIFWMGTFHSICVKILRIHGEKVGIGKNFVIYDSSDQKTAVKEAMKRLDISIKDMNPSAIHSYISSAKNELITPEQYSMYAQGYFQQNVASIYPIYQKVLRENNAVDFDDLLMLTVNLFSENPNLLETFQKKFRYILVDEYQDTNHSQYRLIQMLASGYRNICCVGDDDQSIYAFRGATIKNILNFEKDYPDAKIIKLEQNYRSTQKILEASHQVISKNRNRKDKKLWTENDHGENIKMYKAFDEVSEGEWIIEEIQKEIELGANLNEFAVLYRTNAQSRALEESFINGGIPYRIVGGTQFYERKEIKDIIAYLRLVYNPKDNASLERVINVPRRGIGEKTLSTLSDNSHKKSLSILEYLISDPESQSTSGLVIFASIYQDLIESAKKMKIIEFMDRLLEKTGYIEMLKDGTLEGDTRIENIKELISFASKYEEFGTAEYSLENFLNDVSLLESVSKITEDRQEAVTLMTIHSAKGLEFNYVFIVGVEENLFPHSNSMADEKELEEERRLAYVAITRAKKRLSMTHTYQRRYFGKIQNNPISRFAQDIDTKYIDYNIDEAIGTDLSEQNTHDEFSIDDFVPQKLFPGDKVKHEYFGKGVVRYSDSEMVLVDFGAIHGTKELMLEYARLEKLV